MEITTRQPRPILGVCFPEIFLLKHKIPDFEILDQTSLALLKYFPKYIDRLPSNLKNLKTRIKHIKLIKRIFTDHPNNLLRTLFSNKRKNVRFASGVENRDGKGGYNKQNFHLLKMFPSVQKVKFCAEIRTDEDEDDEYPIYQAIECFWIQKMLNYLNRMTNLKHLTLSNKGRYFLPLLSKVNSFETMLARLKIFKLYFTLFSLLDLPYTQALLKNYRTILKYITHLSLNLPNDKAFFELYKLLPQYCPRLISLSSVLDHKNSLFEDAGCLQCLQNFQNLQHLSLYCLYKLDVFTHCKLPRSLRFLNLYFDETDWQYLVAENSTIKIFHDKQEGLENLEKLQIFLPRFIPMNKEDFIRGFLKDLSSRVLTLREFNIDFFARYQDRNPHNSFDLSEFFSYFQHLSQSLQRLTITDADQKYSFVNFSEARAFHFPILSFLSIQGGSLPSLLSEFENIIELVQVKPDAPAPEIKLDRIQVDSWKSLFELLNSLKKVSGKQIELVIFHKNKGEDDEYFKENYDEQVRKEAKNLGNMTLDIKLAVRWPRFKYIKELKSLEKVFGNFMITENVYL